ncbi:MAG: phosphatidate cytidylyltransferase [Deltaproteobacteria bacterium]|nr:phosphatidate cytidylyltransferase [Deltaproteobacteria bacterium]MBI3078527.1 phosphatidate cytidylyltransferase [Deltaproteobacteria bacterium]
MLWQRIVTAAVVIPLVVALVVFGPWEAFFVVVAGLAVAGLVEFFTLALPGSRTAERTLGLLLGLLVLVAAEQGAAGLAGVTVALMAAALYHLGTWERDPERLARMATLVFGVLYVSLLLSYLVQLRGLRLGREWLLVLLAGVWAGDTAAYGIGKALGRRPLSAQVSPHKTVEGAVAEFGGSLLAVAGSKLTFFPQLGWGDCALLTLGLGVLSQLGDLCESMVKRWAGVKESGGLFPGHGGVLDRIDSLLFSAPFVYYYALYRF